LQGGQHFSTSACQLFILALRGCTDRRVANVPMGNEKPT
jgi:hypothetical protein